MEIEQKVSTRMILLALLEDIEIVSKELLEYMGSSRQTKQDDVDPTQLINLLKQKDLEFQECMRTAKEQGEIQKEIDELRLEVDRRDAYIRQLQKNLKEAEELLSTMIYEAKLKLKSIQQANSRKISSEELIKYAHKISASNSVACPSSWAPGDPRRPYPTEVDMRQGLLYTDYNNKMIPGLSQFSDRQLGGQYQQMGGASNMGAVGSGSLTWQPSAEVQSTLLNRLPSSIEPTTPNSSSNAANNIRMLRDYSTPQQQIVLQQQQQSQQQQQHDQNNKDEVELMSSDSSSSSSSDE